MNALIDEARKEPQSAALLERETPPTELRMDPDEDGQVGIFVGGRQIGAIVVDEENGLRIILGSVDAGGGLQLKWFGDPISFRIALAYGVETVLGRRP